MNKKYKYLLVDDEVFETLEKAYAVPCNPGRVSIPFSLTVTVKLYNGTIEDKTKAS